MVWSMEHYRRIHTILLYLPSSKIKPQEGSGSAIANPLLERKWHQITRDLVTNLPKFDGKTAIATFMDRLSKMVHFAPCTKGISPKKYAKFFINHVFKHHGLLEVIISDRNRRLTNRFWKELFQKLGIDLWMKTASYARTDDQLEVMIRVLEKLIETIC